MKKVRFLLLSILTIMLMTFAMGCEVAGNACEQDSDCGEKEQCFAGYCGEQAPTAGFYLKFDLKNANGKVGQAQLKCADGSINNVDFTISTHDFTLADKTATIACADLNVNEAGDLPNNNNGYLIEGLWPDENYDVKVTFVVEGGTNVDKSFSVRPKIAFTSEPKENNEVIIDVPAYCSADRCNTWETCNEEAKSCDLKAGMCNTKSDCSASNQECENHECVAQATLNVSWKLNDGGSELTSCSGTDVTEFKLALGELPDTDNSYTGYETITCGNFNWSTKVFEVENTSINIYAVDASGEKLFQVESPLNITQSDFDAGLVNKVFTLNAVSNKK